MTDDRRILDAAEVELADTADAIRAEFLGGLEVVAQIDRPAVTLFGSARVRDDHPAYEAARAVARRFAGSGWAVVTGGGSGVMEAGNRGAREGGGLSVGFNIELPHEQRLNAYCDLSYTFAHFYARKACFVRPASGFVAFAGGFGTLDEIAEALVLIQTGKVLHFPVVLFGSEHWLPLLDWFRDRLGAEGMISPDDVELLHLVDDVDEAVRIVLDRHAQRAESSAPHKEDAQ